MCRVRIEEAMKADTGGAIRVEAAERKLGVTGGKCAKRAADTDPEALEYHAAQPEGAEVSQEDAQMIPAAASSSIAAADRWRLQWPHRDRWRYQ